VAKQAARQISPALFWLVVASYVLFALWGFIGRGVGTMLVLTDPRARQALKARERWEGILVGGSAVLGLGLLLAGALLSGERGVELALSGAILAAISVPSALCLSNDNVWGQRLYGAIACFVCLCAIVFLGGITILPGLGVIAMQALSAGVWAAVICTWLAMFRVMYE
jgi:hypothetical protein